ncbi:MAG TPA: dihydrodipicolinate synthase family protein [Chthonomonadaceae bacterium]|nr:dihydrodipicolinate synthase family protein [Chthonomonadaceae bacterium]
MEAKAIFQGCYVATLTPFDSADRLDEGVVRSHAQWLIENGIQGLCPAGTTGEFLYLTGEEKRRLVAATVEATRRRVPVIAGIWALRMGEIRWLARMAEDAGASAVFLPPPIYYPASDETLFAYYAAVHEATALPVFAYNIPQYAANTISTACLERLLSEGIVAGIKDSTGNAERLREWIQQFGEKAVLFAASDSFASEGRRLGAAGFISAIANIAPALFARLWAGEESLQPQVDALRTVLKQVGSIPALKTLAARQGFAFGASRLPFSSLTAEHQVLLGRLQI